ncbi:hypothetical protein [Nocardia sp. XZ_19_231]|uniref:hypothetical protein n=1 Tax=Nocardia sp. XZ_19_231 TaxID=2769252 RepID=UPI00188F2222|nr:hypothetical protein [Nocardia sp. XZ_19_231]
MTLATDTDHVVTSSQRTPRSAEARIAIALFVLLIACVAGGFIFQVRYAAAPMPCTYCQETPR